MNTYTIRELSELFDLPASTLRYYEEVGLLENVARNMNNQRIYTHEHIQRLKGIDCFKKTGLPISKIQEFYTYENNLDEHIDDIINLVSEHENNISNKIAELQHELKHIRHKVRYYEGIKKAIISNGPRPKWSDFNNG